MLVGGPRIFTMRRSVIVLATFLLIATLGVLGARAGWLEIPPEWSPWEPLDVAAAPNLLTRFKLSKLSDDADSCRAVLQRTAIDFELLTDRVTGDDCGFRNAVLVRATPTDVGEEFSLTC